MQRCPPSLALVVVSVVTLGLVGCGGARPALINPSALQQPTTAEGWSRQVARQVWQGQNKRAVDSAAALRRLGQPSATSQAYEVIALARLGRAGKARAIAGQLVARARTDRSTAVWRAIERLVAWYAQAHQKPELAWQFLAPLRTPRCVDARSCDLHARLLVHWQGLTPAQMRARLAESQPAVATATWQSRITRALVDRRRWPLVDAAIADSIARWPTAPQAWSAWMYAARRRRGPQHRTAWESALLKAKLNVAQLRAIGSTVEVEADALLAVSLWQHLLKQPGASDSDKLIYIRLLTRNHRKGVSSTSRDALKRLAIGFSGATPVRLALVEGLLVSGAHAAGADLLSGMQQTPRVIALQAELAREKGALDEARSLAKRAVALAAATKIKAQQTSQGSTSAKPSAVESQDDEVAVALLLATLWRTHLPQDAAGWQKRAHQADGAPSVETAGARALAALSSSRVNPAARRALLAYAKALNRALERDLPTRADAERRRTALCKRLVRASSRWRTVALASLRELARSPHVDAPTFVALARASYAARQPGAGLSAWRMAEAHAREHGLDLDRAGFLALIARGALPSHLARWLRYTGLHGVDDLYVSWLVARRLLFGNHRMLGRQWVAAALARSAGFDAISERLPPLRRVSKSASRRQVRLSSNDLRRLATSGAADLLLDYLPGLRAQGRKMSSVATHLKFDLAEASALAQVGQAQKAGRKLRELAVLGGLRPVDRRRLLSVAWQHGLCDVSLDLAKRFASQRDSRTFKLAIRHGIACAQRMGDTPAAFQIATATTRKQLSLSHQLTMVRELVDRGFDRMAIHFFAGKFRMSRARSSQSSYAAWATALLANGRPESALVRLKRGIKITRRRPQVWRKAVQVLEEYGHMEPAVRLLREGLVLHPKDVPMRLSLVRNLLRLGDAEGFRQAMRDFVRSGPSKNHWSVLLNTAVAQGRVAELHVSLTEMLDHDREIDRVRVRVAAFLGDRRALLAALRRLRAKGPVIDRAVLTALRHVGAEREARAVAQDLVTEQGPSRARRGLSSSADAHNMRAALAVRHDPSSRKEALAFARLRVGRSLNTGTAALASSAALADEGYLQEAQALGALALAEVGHDEALLCRQGKIAFAAGKPKEAMSLWQRAVAATLTKPANSGRYRSRYRRMNNVPPAVTCLVWAADAAGEHAALRRWLRQWRETMPYVDRLWRWTIVASISAGRVADATRTLREAESKLTIWKEAVFGGVVRSILREGGGPGLLASFLANRPRPEPWWLALAYRVAAAHGKADDPAVAALQRDIRGLALNSPKGRAWLSLEYFAGGETERGVATLGAAPLARIPSAQSDAQWRLKLSRVARLASAKRAAALLAKSVPAQTDVAARAAARALIARMRDLAPEESSTKQTIEPSAASIRQVMPTVALWLRTAGVQGAIRLAHALTLQGHPTVGAAVLKLDPPSKSDRLPRWLLERRVRVFAAVGADAELVAAARLALDGTRRRSYYKPLERATAFGRMANNLVGWGRPGAAAQLMAAAPAWALGQAPPGLQTTAKLEGPSSVIRAVRSFDRAGLAWLKTAKPGLLPAGDGMVAVGLALAAGEPALAETWAAATAAHHDAPWLVWLQASRHALDHGDLDAARRFISSAAKARAPEGGLACVRAHLGDVAALQRCRDKRPLAGLPNWQLVAFAAGACHSDDLAFRSALTKDIAASPDSDRLRWIAALAAAWLHLPTARRPHAATLARSLIETLPAGEPRRSLVNVALDDLATLGLGSHGIPAAQYAFDKRPDAHSVRNNLGYARLLAGEPSAKVLAFVVPELTRHRAEPAHALLDTIAAALAKGGQLVAAKRALRWSLSASRTNSDNSQLPLVRYATFLARAGRLAEARVVALGALRRAADLPAITGRQGDGTRSAVFARQISIRTQGLAVLRQYLRAAPAGAPNGVAARTKAPGAAGPAADAAPTRLAPNAP